MSYRPLAIVVVLALGIVPVLGPAAPASAQNDAAQSAQARALFRQGVQAADRLEWEDAADLFRRAMALRPSPVIQFNLAQALIQLGNLVEGTEHLRGVLRTSDTDRRVRNGAESLLRAIEPRLGTLTIRLTGDPRGVSVRVDGRAISDEVVGVAAPANPGARHVTAHRGDVEVAATDVQIAEGGTAEVSLEIPPAPAVPTPVEAARESDRDEQPAEIPRSRLVRHDEGGSVLGEWWFWAMVGVVVAGGVVIGITLTRPDAPAPVQGSLDPGVVEVP